ncbi:MAG: M17 family metallopeptidase [Myxococcota bacterium]
MPDRSRTEARWLIDRVVRRVAALAKFDRATVRGADGVADDTLVTVGLDLYNRTGGAVTMHERGDLQGRVDRVGDLEHGFRTWINEDPSQRTSLAIARDVCDWARSRPEVTVEVMAEPALTRLGMRLLLAVGGGSPASPPRLVIARYRPGGSDEAPLMLIGKGITFDSGGINVKPYESFVSMMKNDMGGSALAFSLFRGLVEAGHDKPLLLVIPTCENAIDARSMRPGSLVKSYRGITVRIDHTDAEGRLVLADGLAYATDTYKPRQVLCFATLTTAALIAYGPYATPVHFADAEFEQALRAASEQTGEDLHFFPYREWHFEANRDREADVRNTARLPGDASRGAGSRNAAHFLKHFTDTPLCHLDIFASTWNWAGDAPGSGYGATGAPLRTLLAAFGVA